MQPEVSQSPFLSRHLGPRESDLTAMLAEIGCSSLEELAQTVVPAAILLETVQDACPGISEEAALSELRLIASRNATVRSLIGQGYYGTRLPAVIRRCVLENPAWYTAYTPYQPEISQGRLELLFYFQTMICELTGMHTANASLLDEATAAAEAMAMCYRSFRGQRSVFFVHQHCHPQTLSVLQSRATPLGIRIETFAGHADFAPGDHTCGVLVQYPDTVGETRVPDQLLAATRDYDIPVVVSTDLLALCRLPTPRELGAEIAVGSAQRFGVAPGFGGPHAGFLAATERFQRQLPGRLVGLSVDRHGNPAYRLSLQTREQHIRREKATSNICTAQALLAILSTLYACYHGPEGLRAIADRVFGYTSRLADGLRSAGYELCNTAWFDTLTIRTGSQTDTLMARALAAGFNLRRQSAAVISLSLDECTDEGELLALGAVFGINFGQAVMAEVDESGVREMNWMSQPVFHRYRSETEMMRYLRRLADKDLALDRTMIPLGSCTMKLNAASEMLPISWPEFSEIHPFAPDEQTAGYRQLINELEQMLCDVTGYDAVSLQPNAGSQGEYAGLLAIRAYHQSLGEDRRDICLIPASAHGTNPASAQMAGFSTVMVRCDVSGNIDESHLLECIEKYSGRIAAVMLTYPSTHGVFEQGIQRVCAAVHDAGGQVYIDGANLNALAGIACPGKFGGDVSHLNLHKTFCIPHGGGGPGVGPVAVRSHLREFLPADSVHPDRVGATISAAPFGSAGILPISWMYLRMMGLSGVRRATMVAILNANYIAHRLRDYCPVLYCDHHGMVAHECILDTRVFEKRCGVTVEDIAKRLIDYGFHAPTMSFPVPGTLMIEPTESESLEEIDRFCDAMISIFAECRQIELGIWPRDVNPLKNAPHTLLDLLQDTGSGVYDKRTAVCPDGVEVSASRYLPPVSRLNQVHGDRHLICSCPPVVEQCESPEVVETTGNLVPG